MLHVPKGAPKFRCPACSAINTAAKAPAAAEVEKEGEEGEGEEAAAPSSNHFRPLNICSGFRISSLPQGIPMELRQVHDDCERRAQIAEKAAPKEERWPRRSARKKK
jgi:hypothetical protein